MRTAIIEEVYKIMKENKNSYFLTGDLGYDTLEKIEQDFGNRFINVGVAEQNMIGIASGLALSGKKVFVYSIIPFLTMRCFEQIRDDICYHDLDVILLGSGSGLSYGILGSTHFALEDIAIMRSLPNMTVFSPADETDAILGMRYFKNNNGPLYVRIGFRKEAKIHQKLYNFELGKGIIIQKGKDLIFFVTGTLMEEVIKAAKILQEKTGLSSTIVDIHTIKPLDANLVLEQVKEKKVVFTVEEHGKTGGLGSAVAEILSESENTVQLIRIGTDDQFISTIGTRSFLRKKLELDSQGIINRIKNYIKNSV